MKHTIFSILLTLLCTTSFAQMQQGVVKTPTRRNVNGTMTKGRYIENATVGILFTNNNSKQSYISGTEGTFSFAASSPYYVTSVVANKGTYTFLDADFAKEQRKYSTNAIEILVDDPNVLKKVREEAMAHEREKIRNQIRAKEDELNSLKTANKISSEEYNKMLDELTKYRNSSEAIVKQIAEVYATKDFDALDDFNKQLLIFVEEGNFASADSLLKTQGSKEELFNRIKKNSAAINKTKEELKLAEEYNNKEKDAFAQRLYSEHLMYLQQPMMQDSALYCLKMRADLDTTNVDAVRDYAALCYEQTKYLECERYYMICLRAYTLIGDIGNRATILNNLGNLFQRCFDFDKCEKYYNLSLQDFTELFKANPDLYRECLAMLQNNMGNMYDVRKDNTNSEKFFRSAIDNFTQLYNQNPDKYRALLAQAQNNLGILYFSRKNYEISKHYLTIALQNRGQLFRQDPNTYRSELAESQNNLGMLYYRTQNLQDSEKFYKAAIDNYEHLFKNNPDKYRQGLARVLNNLGDTYSKLKNYANSEKYYKSAVVHGEKLYKQNPDIFKGDLAMIYYKLAYSSADISHFSEAISSINKSISLIPKEAYFYDAKGEILLMQGKNDEALKMWEKVMELNPNILDGYPDGTNLSNGLKKIGLIK